MPTTLTEESAKAVANASGGLNQVRGRLLKILAAILLAVACYAIFIEPHWIEVTHSDMHGDVAAPLKIAQVSDVHTVGFGRRERRVLEILNEEQPDAIVVTGDTIGKWFGTTGIIGDYPKAKVFYQQLHAPLGVWVVRGNWETAKPIVNEQAFYQSAGVHFLLNAGAELRPDVWIAGLDDWSRKGKPKPDDALAGAPASAYTILLIHEPAYFDHVAGRVKLVLAGHTHGGQVRLPFAKPLWLPSNSWPYVEGWYERNGSKMYVSRGIGTSILPMRFLARPEVSIVTIHPSNEP